MWCLPVALLVISACGPNAVAESILPAGDTELSILRGGSLDTLCSWTRERFAEAKDTDCDLGDPNAAPEYSQVVRFAGANCGREPKISDTCGLRVDGYGDCVDALVADACAAEATERCSKLGECAVAEVELALVPGCDGLSQCCKEIETNSERQRCQSVVATGNELACGLELAAYVGFCPEANDGASK
ncbi:MAG: hypothetical protein JW940_39620 [Polyangiaceae bacterium]|nr:hypothetical protein [Polyangiaceae bacterium]